MIVYAHSYNTASGSKKQYTDFQLWAARELPTEISVWRTRTVEGDRYFIPVVDASEAHRSLTDFTWKGEWYGLPLEIALGFVRRRQDRIAALIAEGQSGRVTDLRSWEPAVAPVIRADGSWELP